MSEKDILIIPTFSRPEMLWVCLDYIAKCPEANLLDIRVCVDTHENNFRHPDLRDIATVLSKFPTLHVDMTVRSPHGYYGNSYNVLSAYRDAYDTHAQYVFMVEDDIMVAKDFFEWHYSVQKELRNCFCSIGTLNQRSPIPNIPVTEKGFYTSYKDYASWGVCFRREVLRNIIRHAHPDYFSHMEYYIRHHLSGFGFDSEYCEQDGLIVREMGREKGFSIYPTKAHAQHVGWYGYHRTASVRPEGSLEERYHHVKKVVSDPVELKKHVHDFYDIEVLRVD
jgi:hypothetical protein